MKNFDDLPVATLLTGTETFALNQAGQTRKGLISALGTYLAGVYDAIGTAAAGMVAHLSAFTHGDIAHGNRGALDLVSGSNTGDQDIAGWLSANKPGISSLESAGVVSTWVPSDMSGAGLTLTPINCQTIKIGKLVHLMGQITFPTTADINAAKIGGLPNNPIALHNGIAFNTIGSSLFGACTVIPGSVLQFYNNFGAATPRTNATLSGATVYVNISYLTT